VERVWAHLFDVERIAPCLPGAELTEIVDERTWKGTLKTTFGPVVLTFTGTVEMQERDDAGHRLVLRARGLEQKGRGAAQALVTSWLEPGSLDHETRVRLRTDIAQSGAAAQLSRGLLPEISRKLAQRFADCLESSMAGAEAPAAPSEAGAPAPAAPAPPPAAKPVGGIRLGLSAIWAKVVNVFRRLFGRRPKT
jgi:carbon monoxide dehydrogenase subunit G